MKFNRDIRLNYFYEVGSFFVLIQMALSSVFLILFILLSIIHTIGEFLEGETKLKVRTMTKPFLLPLVVIYYLIACDERGIAPVILIVIGLILGFVGDVTLLKPKVQILFMIGLGSFLIGHLLYIISFITEMNGFTGVPAGVYITILGYALFFVLVFRYLKDSLKEMTVPVVIYMTIILVMSFCALALMYAAVTGAVRTPWLAFVGSLNFIASDLLLANQLFKKPFKYDQAIIMVTYLVAQLLIAQAYL
jgi:uncharacterized membrane protein YhhN